MRNNEITELRDELPVMTPKAGLTEKNCIERINEALKLGYVDYDSDSDGMLYLEIETKEAERLYNDLFENGTFEDYLNTYEDDTKAGCDICNMWGLLCNIISDDVQYNFKTHELYKPI